MHSEPCPRLPVPRRQLHAALVSEDEEGGVAHATVPAQVPRGMPNLQAADCPVLLSRQAVQRAQVPGALLSEYQAEAAPAANATAAAELCDDATTYRPNVQHDGRRGGSGQASCHYR